MAPTPQPMIQIVDLHKSFGSHEVLSGITLEVPPGSTLVILGGSGSGKTVLMKHMIGLLKPDSGRVIIDGEDIVPLGAEGLEKMRRKFGMVFQAAALFDSMTVFENVSFPLREHRKELSEEQIRALVKEKLGIVGLKNVEEKYPADLSGGMRKRVGLARAIVLDPKIVLYDEPTTGLDPILTGAMDKLISDTQEAHPTLTSLIISHDMHAVMSIADKIVMLFEGQVVHEGTPDYFRDSSDPLIRQFMSGSLDGPMKV